MNRQVKAALFLLLLFAVPAGALRTNTWPFDVAGDYVVSDTSKVEVAAGVARLKLQPAQIYHNDVRDYMDANASRMWLGVGTDVSLVLRKTGAVFDPSGLYTSRIVDGGFNNEWQSLRANMPTLSGLAGVVAWYRLDNDGWLDQVTGLAATPVGTPLPGFTTDAIRGTHAAQFNGTNRVVTVNRFLLNGKRECSVLAWVRILAPPSVRGGVYVSRADGAIGLTALSSMRTVFWVSSGDGNKQSITSTTALEAGRWYFVVGTWRSSDGQHRIFVNGLPEAQKTSLTGLTLIQRPYPYNPSFLQESAFILAREQYDVPPDTGYNLMAVIDDAIVLDRALSAEEVWALYQFMAGIQVRSASTPEELQNKPFVGPSGTTNTYYVDLNQPLVDCEAFRINDRYAQYQLRLNPSRDGLTTPYVDAVVVAGTKTVAWDSLLSDFRQGAGFVSVTNLPLRKDTSYLGLGKHPNGGYYTNGTYTSRVFDGGAGAGWNQMSWTVTEALPNDIGGLEGLWHVDGTWADSAKGRNRFEYNAAFSPLAKQGPRAALFNGVDSYTEVPMGTSTVVKTVEFWINNQNVHDGIMELGTNAYMIVLSNRNVAAVAFSNVTPVIYVNGRRTTEVLPGWNHVVLAADRDIMNAVLRIGVAGGDFMDGLLDEIAVYNRSLQEGEIQYHYTMLRRPVGGRLRVQGRAGNTSPLTGAFGDLYESPSGTPPLGMSGRYFQYRVVMESDGLSTPALDSLTIAYSGGTFSDRTSQDFHLGSFDGGTTRWIGDEVKMPDIYTRGAVNKEVAAGERVEGLWHMDEEAWGLLFPVLDSSGYGLNGTANGDAKPSGGAAVGARCGVLDGTGDWIDISSQHGAGDFSVGIWVRTTSANRSAVIATGDGYYIMEINSDGGAYRIGQVAWVMNDGSNGVRIATGRIGAINDGKWHHLMGIRNGRQSHLYIDGILAATVDLGAGYGSRPSGSAFIGKAAAGLSLAGFVDEAVIYSRAISAREISDLAAAGFDTVHRGVYESAPIDAAREAFWQNITWTPDAPYSRPLSAAADVMGLWHMDGASSGQTPDSSGRGLHGTVVGPVVTPLGRFNAGLTFNGTNQYVEVADDAGLEAPAFTVEAWVYPDLVDDRAFISKEQGGTGYRLGTDAAGRAIFVVNGTACAATEPLRSRQWHHMAGAYDGQMVRLYVDGLLRATVALDSADVSSSAPLRMGTDNAGAGDFAGWMDEVAVHSRALTAEEIFDHYRAGAGQLRLQVRSWSQPGPPGPFVGPDGTTNTYFTDPTAGNLIGVVPLGQYFQYRAEFETEDHRWTPRLHGVRVDVSGYPTDNPWVAPSLGKGHVFLGRLTQFFEKMGAGNQGTTRYFISGNNGTNWYYWDGYRWSDAGVFGWDVANPATEVNNRIGSFYDQLYDKTGGVFRFKAFLHSEGIDQVELDEVSLGYSEGRIVVLAPNGTEIGDQAWLIGYPQTIRWSSAGTVSGNLAIEFSRDSGSTWTPITNGIGNVGSYVWVPPGIGEADEETRCRIRIRDRNNNTIQDVSDADFELRWKFRLTAPNGGERWYIGETNRIQWESAINLGAVIIDYAADGSNFLKQIAFNYPNLSGTTNVYPWPTPRDDAGWLSENGVVRIRTLASKGTDTSDQPFTLAGIVVTQPRAGQSPKRGAPFNIQWTAAGAGDFVRIRFSANGGATWTNIALAVANRAGTNTYSWLIETEPTEQAMIEVASTTDAKVWDRSDIFTVADIDILQPDGPETWLVGTTQEVVWLSAGASETVNLAYSTNSGTTWIPLVSNYENAPGSNTYTWAVPPQPGRRVRFRVQDGQDPDNLWAMSEADFRIAGIRVVSPDGGEKWTKDETNLIRWAQQSVGAFCTIEFSYDGGLSYTNVAGPGIGLSDETYPYAARIPTVRAKARVRADDPTPFTNVWDESDAFFTVAGILMTAPTGGTTYTIGRTNLVAWRSAGSEDPLGQARIFYSSDGVTFTNLLSTVGNNQAYPGDNQFFWITPMDTEPSANARIRVVSGDYSHDTERFILRGIKITTPAQGGILTIGNNETIVWRRAGLSEDANVDIFISTDGGVTYQPDPINAVPWPVNAEAYPWAPVPFNLNPTTNAVIRMTVVSSSQASDVGLTVFSRPFTLRGMRITSPVAGDLWALGESRTIAWRSADAGHFVDILYSANGGLTYDTRPIAQNAPNVNGTNARPWNIEFFRTPSTNARIRIQSATLASVSEPFTVRGIRVTSPISSDIWAVDETNRIAWTSVGVSGPYRIEYILDGSETNLITTNAVTRFYDWVIPPEAVSTDVVVRVSDVSGAVSGSSDRFKIVSEPTVEILYPAGGDLWAVSETRQIVWSKGGKMGGDFRVFYSTEPFLVTNDIVGTVEYDPTNNTYFISWPVPDRVGATVVGVQNVEDPRIKDMSDEFYVVGKFTVLFPNGGPTETNLYANKTTTVSWYTRGSVPRVHLYYSADPLYQPGSWVPIVSNLANNGQGVGDVLTTYDWTLPNLWSDDIHTVRFRVQQADRPGAYDDSDANFSIRYYTILWQIFDAATSNALDKLSVNESTGWAASGLASPVQRKYAFGVYDTVWFREYFYDNVIFKWTPEPSRTIPVPMIRSQVEPDYYVMADFFYDAPTGEFRIQAWLERSGKVFPTPHSCVIRVFDKTGAEVTAPLTATPDANGVFWLTWNVSPSLPRGQIYFAKVSIVLSGVTYSSGLTFNLRVPSTDEQAQMILDVVQTGTNQLREVGADVAAIRGVVTAGTNMAAAVSNLAALIFTDTQAIRTNTDLLPVLAEQMALLTNTIGVIGPDGTSVVQRLDDLVANVARARGGAILTRPTSVRVGSTVTIYYRNRSGLSPLPRLRVLDDSGTEVYSALMTEIGTTGIYEHNVPFVGAWAVPGEITIECADSDGTDRLVIRLTRIELDDLASLTDISNRLDRLDSQLAAVYHSVTSIERRVETFDFSPLTNLDRIITVLTNVNWDALSNVNMLAESIDALRTRTESVWTNTEAIRAKTDTINWTNVTEILSRTRAINWTNVTDTLALAWNISNRVALMDLGPLTNISDLIGAISNLNVEALTNINELASGLQAIRAKTDTIEWSNVVEAVALAWDISNRVGEVDLGPLTNISDLIGAISNLNVEALTNINELASGLQAIRARTDTIDWNDITGIATQTAAIKWQDVTDALAMAQAASNQTARINWDDIGRIYDLAWSISNTLGTMDLGPLTNIADLAAAISNMNISALTNISALAEDVQAIRGRTDSINWTNISQLLATSGDLLTLTQGITNTLQAMDLGPLTNLPQIVGLLTNVDWAALSDMEAVKTGVEALQNWSATVNWSDVAALMAGVEALEFMTTSYWDRVSSRVGSERDGPDADTLFGRIAAVLAELEQVGADAAAAVKKAGTAQTAAGSAASGIQSVKRELAAGQLGQMAANVAAVRDALTTALEQLQGIPEEIGSGRLVDAFREALDQMKRLAEQQGVPLAEMALPSGPITDAATIMQLNNNLAEMKAMMDALRTLMDEAVNKPVVVEWLEARQ